MRKTGAKGEGGGSGSDRVFTRGSHCYSGDMQDSSDTEPVPELTLSVVLFRSPLDQLRALIESAVASLRAANLSRVQMVCWDNSCDVAYSERCQNLLADFASDAHLAIIHVIADHNEGYGAGHNRAMSSCVGQFHLILNPDVQLAANAIRIAMDAMTAQSSVALLAPTGWSSDGEPEYLAKAYPSVWVLGLRAFAPAWLKRLGGRGLARYEMRDQPTCGKVRPIVLASGCCMWVRRSVFENVGGFDERFFLYFEDYDLSLKMAQIGKVLEHSQIRIVHHGGDAARKGVRHILWFIWGAIRFFRRWGWKWFC